METQELLSSKNILKRLSSAMELSESNKQMLKSIDSDFIKSAKPCSGNEFYFESTSQIVYLSHPMIEDSMEYRKEFNNKYDGLLNFIKPNLLSRGFNTIKMTLKDIRQDMSCLGYRVENNPVIAFGIKIRAWMKIK